VKSKGCCLRDKKYFDNIQQQRDEAMKFLLTSVGVNNKSIHSALVAMLE
jgi:hypothetical protein